MLSLIKKHYLTQLIIIMAGCLLFLPGLGGVHLFDWDEINFAESAREMLVCGNYLDVQINFEPFWEKPPLFIWMQVASMKLFGINEFAARFPNVLCGIVTLLFLYNIGRHLKGYKFGVLWAACYLCSLLPFFYFKSGIIDPWFNLFIFLGIYFFAVFTMSVHNAYKHLGLSGLCFGLAVLTKGPVAILIFLLSFTVFLIYRKFKLKCNYKQVIWFAFILTIVSGFWFLLQMIFGNSKIIAQFIEYQIRLFQTEDAGHGGFFMYHFVILLMGVFPASILALPTFRRKILSCETSVKSKRVFEWTMILFWVVLLLFSIVQTKIIHYSSLCYFPLSFLAAYYVYQVIQKKARIKTFQKAGLIFIAAVWGVAALAITTFDQWKKLLIATADEFTVGNLQATSSWLGFEPLIGVLLIAATIYFCWKINSKRSLTMFGILLGSTLFYIFSIMLLVVPNVEKYTQNAMIEFLKSKADEDCYFLPIHYSYAHYFYGNIQYKMPNQDNDAERQQAMNGTIDKPCYFILRNTERNNEQFLTNASEAQRLYDKNGFVFYVGYPAEW
ncbi:MAG: glycosyltransferase family 39 protein [Prevotellaceae bacterium]|jgi:4-amino-4-deoxy-L-arabinose transferase-like glycosyltransferase|nr:glycosyltransferase family 39 protein [Prevotellaceae bacterium]